MTHLGSRRCIRPSLCFACIRSSFWFACIRPSFCFVLFRLWSTFQIKWNVFIILYEFCETGFQMFFILNNCVVFVLTCALKWPHPLGVKQKGTCSLSTYYCITLIYLNYVFLKEDVSYIYYCNIIIIFNI
jgi:hypothetical protein